MKQIYGENTDSHFDSPGFVKYREVHLLDFQRFFIYISTRKIKYFFIQNSKSDHTLKIQIYLDDLDC